MTFYFFNVSTNWADEFDVESAFVMTKEEYDSAIEKIKQKWEDGVIDDGTEFYFGTNEALQFADFEDFMNDYAPTECSKEFYEEFQRLVPYGIGPNMIERMLECEGDEDYDGE